MPPIAQFSGIASGIDSAALIDAIINARNTTNVIRKNNIEQLKSANTALQELNTMAIALNGLIDQFRTVNGGGVKKSATSSDSDVLLATAGSNATNGTYDITVTSLAKTATASFSDSSQTYSSLNSIFSAENGQITLQVGTGDNQKTVNVDITGGETTLQGVLDAINGSSNATGRLSATAVNVGTTANPEYKVVVSTLKSGSDEGRLEISTSGDPDFTSNFSSNLDQATNALFSIQGIGNIERSSNTISDVLPGLSFQLKAAGNSTITVGTDTAGTAESIREIVDKFNEIVKFVKENDSIERTERDGRVSINYGSLAKMRVDNEYITQFRSSLVSATAANGVDVKKLSELGISTNRDGTLSFDEDEFIEKLNKDPLGASELLQNFANSTVSTNGTLRQFTRFNGAFELTMRSNEKQIQSLNDQVERLDRSNEKYRDILNQRFARLESISSDLQSQQNALGFVIQSLF